MSEPKAEASAGSPAGSPARPVVVTLFRRGHPGSDACRTRWGRRAAIALVVILGFLPTGCATLLGLPFSPLSGAVSNVAHSAPEGWDVLWGYPLAVVMGAIWGPVVVTSVGISADLGWIGNGAYGVDGAPAMLDVFDPFGYCLSGASREKSIGRQ
jgi:hypothetical protein